MAETRDCPDCEQGKHTGCLEKVFDDSDLLDDNWWVPCPCAERGHTKKPMEIQIERKNKYNIVIDGFEIRATDEQLSRIRSLHPDQLTRFRKIMGGK